MQTTSVYIEHVIIGAEVSAWLYALFALIDSRVIDATKALLASDKSIAPLLIILLGVCYVIGLLADRLFDTFFDWILRKPESVMRKLYGIDSATVTRKVYKDNDDTSTYDFHISRRRIIRGTSFNILLIGALWVALFLRSYGINGNLWIAAIVLLFSAIFSFACLYIYYKLLLAIYIQIRRYINPVDIPKVRIRDVRRKARELYKGAKKAKTTKPKRPAKGTNEQG